MHTHRQFWPTPTSECIDHSRKLLPQWGIRPRAVWPSSKAPPSGAKRTIFQSCILWFVDLITDQMLLWTVLKNKVNSPRLSYAKLQKSKSIWHGSISVAPLVQLVVALDTSLNLWRLTFSLRNVGCCMAVVSFVGEAWLKHLKISQTTFPLFSFFSLWFTANPQNCWQNLSLYFSAEHI